jgi:hypothetical protein
VPRVSYELLPGFDGYYLEDSSVLRISATATEVTFWLDVVLTPKHPLYSPPKPGEQHCYRQARLVFHPPAEVVWEAVRIAPSRDADGEVDFGSIDLFSVEDDWYMLGGDWGRVRIRSSLPSMVLD